MNIYERSFSVNSVCGRWNIFQISSWTNYVIFSAFFTRRQTCNICFRRNENRGGKSHDFFNVTNGRKFQTQKTAHRMTDNKNFFANIIQNRVAVQNRIKPIVFCSANNIAFTCSMSGKSYT